MWLWGSERFLFFSSEIPFTSSDFPTKKHGRKDTSSLAQDDAATKVFFCLSKRGKTEQNLLMLRASLFTLFTARHKVPYCAFLAILYIHPWVRTSYCTYTLPRPRKKYTVSFPVLLCRLLPPRGPGSGLDIVTERVGWWSFPYGEMQKHKVEG